MAEAEQPADSSILTALYPEEAKKIAQIEMLRRQRGEMTDYTGRVRRPQAGGLLARSRARDGMPGFANVAGGSGPAVPQQPPPPAPGLMRQQVPGLGQVGGPAPGAPGPQMQQIPGLGNVPAPNAQQAAGPRPQPQRGLPQATGRAQPGGSPGEPATPPGHPSSHEPAQGGPAAAQIDPNSIEGLYQQGQELRRRAYGTAPDPEVQAQERAKADENWFRGTMMQAIGGSGFGASGGAVLQQALKRQSELELNPEVEVARKVRALEAEAQALERRAERTQNAEDKRIAEEKRIEQRQWEAKEGHLNRLAQIQAAAAGRTPADPMLPVVDPNDPTKTIYVPRSQAGGMQAGKPGGTGGAAKPPTADERTTAGFLHRMTAAEKIISDPALVTGQKPWIVEAGARALGMETGANAAVSAQRQQVRQAQEDWVRAKLRRESGAVIGENEMDSEIRLYFPQIGDKPALIKQKAQARQRAQEQMQIQGGSATAQPGAQPGAPTQPGAPKPVAFKDL
jgi:hypothetical protein